MEVVVTLEEVVVAQPGLTAFEDAFPRLFQDAYRVGFRLLGDRNEAEDVAQEACARTYSRWSGVHDYAEAWCVRVASNLALDALRARARGQRRQHQVVATSTPSPAAAVDDRLDLYAALAALPRRQREVVVLRYLGDLSEQQTAAVVGCSVGSVKTHSSRGLGRLRDVLER
jgi:RNA polymerase sigma-70 factor (sigma-E family)